ncbi:hypothetical protein ACXWOS_10370, partial [Streptococcus pyogenes]
MRFRQCIDWVHTRNTNSQSAAERCEDWEVEVDEQTGLVLTYMSVDGTEREIRRKPSKVTK